MIRKLFNFMKWHALLFIVLVYHYDYADTSNNNNIILILKFLEVGIDQSCTLHSYNQC